MSLNRKLKYSLAINEALSQMMEKNPEVFLLGQGVKSAWYVGNTCQGLLEKFGEKRVIDTPLSENAITAIAAGSAIVGMRPVVAHPRMDFMVLGSDAVINQIANWSYMFGGESFVPIVIWAIINRKGEQGAQHSQALQSTFAHIPGLKVVMPSGPNSAKGLLISAIKDDNPVLFIDNRELYDSEDFVPEEIYETKIGKAVIKKQGSRATVVAISHMVGQVLSAVEDIDVEVIDLLSIKPWDKDLVFESVKKTGRLIVVDEAWNDFGIAAEIIASVAEKGLLKSAPRRLCLPNAPAPSAESLEKEYYLNKEKIKYAVQSAVRSL